MPDTRYPMPEGGAGYRVPDGGNRATTPPIVTPMDVSLATGARTLSRGLRTGSAGVAGLGALLLALAVIRRGEPRKTLVYRTTLRPGQSLRVALTHAGPDQPQSSNT